MTGNNQQDFRRHKVVIVTPVQRNSWPIARPKLST